MKRKLLLLGLVGMLVLGISGPLFAGSYKAVGIGTRALSKGGAFIGQADDWTAIYWNPAGLAQLKKGGVGIEPHYLYCRQYDGKREYLQRLIGLDVKSMSRALMKIVKK